MSNFRQRIKLSLLSLLALGTVASAAHAGPSATAAGPSEILTLVKSISGEFMSDVDWTLVYPVKGNEPHLDMTKVVSVDGKLYRVSDHAPEVLSLIAKMRGFRVSFFSGGMYNRNAQLLQEVKVDHRSLFDLATEKVTTDEYARRKRGPIAPRVFSFNDLIQIKKMENPFQFVNGYVGLLEYFRKDLSKVLPYSSLKKVVLADDHHHILVEGQSENLLWLGKTYNFVEDFDSYVTSGAPIDRYDPPDKESWLFERNKWPWLLGVVLEAQVLMRQEGRSFAEAVHLVRTRAHRPEFRWGYVNAGLKKLNKPEINEPLIRCAGLENLMP